MTQRKISSIARARETTELNGLTQAQLGTLYDIIVDEAENWDGEFVRPETIARMMAARYMKVGLLPSRN